jgi:hypothetical protein
VHQAGESITIQQFGGNDREQKISRLFYFEFGTKVIPASGIDLGASAV